MKNVKFKMLENRYLGKSKDELKEIYQMKRSRYSRMMKILNPIQIRMDFLDSEDIPLWVKIAHIDEFLECPHCLEEYREKLKKMN